MAISGAVITGTLLVGDSVQYSLNRIVEQRLGEVTHVLKAGDRYFTGRLSQKVSEDLQVPVSSLLLQRGSAIGDGGQLRVNRVQVLGVDEAFDAMAGQDGFFSGLSGDTVIISTNLARRLNKSRGDELLLRIEKASLIPLNAPFVSDAEVQVSLRAVIRDIADEERMGRFNLEVSQTAPFNVFMASRRLQQLMDFRDRVNVMLVADASNRDPEEIMEVVARHFSAADAGLKIDSIEALQQLQISSDRVFIDENLSAPLISAGDAARGGSGAGEGIITYFVNSLEAGDRRTPYSFVSTLEDQGLGYDEMIINRWLAGDLKAGPGDSIRMTWFEVGPLRELKEVSSVFLVKSVKAMEGRFADASLMPDLPGLSDAGNCRDWDTGVPIDLESIRDSDEDYWDEYGGLPKAYISPDRAVDIWKNRFGVYTSVRYDHMDVRGLEASLLKVIEPGMLGFTMEATRAKGEEAAGNGVDFSQLFAGLSFFLLLAGVILTILLFLLNIESREAQLKTLVSLGIPSRKIHRIMFVESMIVALAGAAAGLFLAILYNRLVFQALNGIWKDVVRTEMMHVEVTFSSLLTGFFLSLIIAFLSFWFPLKRRLKRLVSAHKKGFKPKGLSRLPAILALVSGMAAAAMVVSQLLSGRLVNSALFFPAGGLLLLSAVSFFSWYLGKSGQASSSTFRLSLLSWKNVTRLRTRSMSIVILFAIGAFLVISTGSNRKDLFASSDDPGSGTGGFPLLCRVNHAGPSNS